MIDIYKLMMDWEAEDFFFDQMVYEYLLYYHNQSKNNDEIVLKVVQ